ncbi:SDR family NAD(P)-dependent oxidoreductase [Actinomadura madurae]|uniref:SDR family NAD(P)-dependent oxidoreductase n=1 Tax=Actinomadura madurae TaxID=1993 RepID=UPI0020273A06|nr:SDR family NAD(P)-dependent oxidoreductase [Actinomadura madurae]URM94746.1 SDR family NAD(P)-dependent oxidoreductase [Actinomadura madurae]
MTTTNKIVLITGANKGIGLATAGAMAREGHTVLLGARDPERGAVAAAGLSDRGLDARYVRLDVTDPATISAAAVLIDADYGRLDVLVNNAAIAQGGLCPPDELPVTALRTVYETNVLGVVAVTNAMLPLLRRSPAGYIGNVSSGLGTFAFLSEPGEEFGAYANLLGYNSSKAALNAVTLIYANALRDSGIQVNALSPGFCATDLNGHTGVHTAEEGGAYIAEQLSRPESGAFLNENGGIYPW